MTEQNGDDVEDSLCGQSALHHPEGANMPDTVFTTVHLQVRDSRLSQRVHNSSADNTAPGTE